MRPVLAVVDGGRGRQQQVELMPEEGGARGGASAREFEAAGSTCSGTRAPWEEHERSSG